MLRIPWARPGGTPWWFRPGAVWESKDPRCPVPSRRVVILDARTAELFCWQGHRRQWPSYYLAHMHEKTYRGYPEGGGAWGWRPAELVKDFLLLGGQGAPRFAHKFVFVGVMVLAGGKKSRRRK